MSVDETSRLEFAQIHDVIFLEPTSENVFCGHAVTLLLSPVQYVFPGHISQILFFAFSA
jgi:hypothetical protein